MYSFKTWAWSLFALLVVPTISLILSASLNCHAAYVCQPDEVLDFITFFSILTGVASVLLIGFIKGAGVACRNNRHLLLLVFRPGLYIVRFSAIFVVLANAGLAAVSIYLLFSLIGRIPIGIFIALGAVGIGTTIKLLKTCFKKWPAIQIQVFGHVIKREQFPEFTKLARIFHQSRVI